MARKKNGTGEPEVRKIDLINAIWARDPRTKVRAIVEELAGQGVKVTPSFVYYAKRKRGAASRRAKREAVVTMAGPEAVQIVSRVRALANEVGGMKQLKKLVDLIAE